MNAITKELLDALKGAVAQMNFAVECVERGRHGEAILHLRSFTRGRSKAIAKAEAALAAPQPPADAVEAAFREGFRSPTTYNDTVMNSEDDAWENSEARAEAALAAPQPAADGWIPLAGGDCPVESDAVITVKLRKRHINGHFYIVAYRVVKP